MQIGKRLIRVYYHIEDAGIKRLTELVNDYLITTKSIQTILNYDFCEENTNEKDTE